jgi:uncharacterized protein (TIGR02996 family)
MKDEQAFLQAMLADPNDLTLRLVFADWLEERGDSRGELLRLTHNLTQAIDDPQRTEMEARMQALRQQGVQPIGPFWTNSIGVRFALIPPGTFLMGSSLDEGQRVANETPHRVTLTQGFALGIHLVTQTQWQAVMGKNPSHFKGDPLLPVDGISWFHAVTFCNKLSNKDGKKPYYRIDGENVSILGGTGYLLPTEAEWEYAFRVGTTTPFHFGNTISTKLANYRGEFVYGRGVKGEYRRQTTPVGSFPANAWGLFDMHGNLLEWCWDRSGDYPEKGVADPQGAATGHYRVMRGGCWHHHPWLCRSAHRNGYAPFPLSKGRGVRVCCCLD